MAVLTLITLLAVLGQLPQQIELIPENYLPLIVYGLLTAFAITFSVPLSEGELSIAHAIGIVGLLSLISEIQPALTITIFLGGLLGGLTGTRWGWQASGRHRHNRWRTLIYIVARVTLSFFVASRVYLVLFENNVDPFVRIGIFSLLYVVLYFAIFALQIYSDALPLRGIIDNNLVTIIVLLVLPIPFAIIGAEVAANWQNAIPEFIIVVLGILLTIGGLHALNRSEQKLKRQITELQTLASINNGMHGNLDLNALLHNLHRQIHGLIQYEHLVVVLCDEDTENNWQYPLVIRSGETVTPAHPPLDRALIRHVIEKQAALCINENLQQTMDSMGLHGHLETVSSWMGVPLVVGEKVLGALVISSNQPHHRFMPEDKRLLTTIGSSTSIMIENAQLYSQQSQRAEQLATLNKVASLLSGTLSPNEVLDDIISSAAMVSNSAAAAVHLYWQGNKKDLNLVRSAGLSEGFETQVSQPRLAHLLNQQTTAANQMEPVIVSNIEQTNKDPLAIQLAEKENKAAWIELPLFIGDSVLGVLSLYFDEAQQFAPDHIDLLQAFATQAALAINNARLFTSTDEALERRMEQLFALAVMGRLLNATMDASQIYDIVLQYALDATQAPRGAVVLRHGNMLTIPAQQGYAADIFKDTAVIQQGLSGRVLESGQTVRVGDIREETGYLPLVPTTRSVLIVPVQRGKDVLGIIMIEHDVLGAFSAGDSYFVSQIANQSVIAADNTQLFHRIREGRDRLQVILNTMHEGIVLIDAQQTVALANPRVDLIGFLPDQLLDQPLTKLLADSKLNFAERLGFSNAAGIRKLLEDLQQGDYWTDYPQHTYEVHSDYGLLSIQRQIIPVRDRQGNPIGLLLVLNNKTEELELERARESLSQMIIHDLRSPLTAVTTSLRLLQQLIPDDSDTRPLVEKTVDASQSAIRKVLTRVDSLLDIAKMESGTINLNQKQTELATLVDSVCIELSPLAHELNVKITSQVSDELPHLDIDADKVERLLLNLVDNALKYSPESSTILIQAEISKEQPDFIRIDVIDEGPGVPDEHKKRLFERFAQLDGRKIMRRGVGLGLAFCRMVADAHGGEIWIEDNPAGGSIFAFTLPIYAVNNRAKSS